MSKKSKAYYRFCRDKEKGKYSYYDPEEFIDIIDDFEWDGNIDDALEVAEEGCRQHPGNEEIEQLLVILYLQHKRIDDAEKIFAKYDGDGSYRTAMISFHIKVCTNHPRKALDEYLTELKKGRVSIVRWLETVDNLFDQIPKDILGPRLMKVVKYAEGNATALSTLGSMLLGCNLANEAAALFNKALDINAYDIFSWKELTRCYLQVQEVDRCIETAEFGLAVEPHDPMLNFACGYIHFIRKEYNKAIPHLEIMRKHSEKGMENDHSPLTPEEIKDQTCVSYWALGSCYLATKQLQKATECFETLTELEPDRKDGWFQLYTCYTFGQKIDKSLECLDNIIKLDPKDKTIYALKIMLLKMLHRDDEALKAMKGIVKLSHYSPTYMLLYAEMARQSKKYEECDRTYRAILKKKSKNKNVIVAMKHYFEIIADHDALEQLKRDCGEVTEEDEKKFKEANEAGSMGLGGLSIGGLVFGDILDSMKDD